MMIEEAFLEEVWNITLLSLRVSGTAVLLGSLIGIPVGMVLGFKQFRGKTTLMRFIDVMLRSIINTFMGLPPVVVGLVVYLLLTASGPLGRLKLLYTPTAMIITQLIMVTPIVIGVTMSAVGSVEKAVRERALSLGATETQAAWLVLREARMGVLTSIIVAFGAAISEVGGIMMTGGNIRWVTRTLTTAIVVETELGNFTLAIFLGIILLSVAFAINLILTILQMKGAKR
ncbi:MAG: ABC transporter permease [Candidatus Bathyarchaeia archaeon]